MQRVLSIVVAVVGLGMWIDPAPGETQDVGDEYVRAGNVLFLLPEGWSQHHRLGGTAVCRPPNLQRGEAYDVRIHRPVKPADTVAQSLKGAADRTIEAMKLTDVRFLPPQPPRTLRHPDGYQYGQTTLSAKTSKGAFVHVRCYAAHVEPGRAECITVIASHPELVRQHWAQTDALIGSVKFGSRIVLVEGEAPLTRLRLDIMLDAMEWMINVPMTAEQRQQAREHLIEGWKKQEAPMGLFEIWNAVLADPIAAETSRQTKVKEGMAHWRTSKAPVLQFAAGLYDDATRALAPGPPPLTRQAADASLEMMYFMASELTGNKTLLPPREHKEQWAAELTARFGTLPEQARRDLAQAPDTWAMIRAIWPRLLSDERAQVRAAWAKRPDIKALAAEITRASQGAEGASAPAAGGAGKAKQPMSNAEFQAKMSKQVNRDAAYQMITRMSMETHRTNMAAIGSWSGDRYRWSRN